MKRAPRNAVDSDGGKKPENRRSTTVPHGSSDVASDKAQQPFGAEEEGVQQMGIVQSFRSSAKALQKAPSNGVESNDPATRRHLSFGEDPSLSPGAEHVPGTDGQRRPSRDDSGTVIVSSDYSSSRLSQPVASGFLVEAERVRQDPPEVRHVVGTVVTTDPTPTPQTWTDVQQDEQSEHASKNQELEDLERQTDGQRCNRRLLLISAIVIILVVGIVLAVTFAAGSSSDSGGDNEEQPSSSTSSPTSPSPSGSPSVSPSVSPTSFASNSPSSLVTVEQSTFENLQVGCACSGSTSSAVSYGGRNAWQDLRQNEPCRGHDQCFRDFDGDGVGDFFAADRGNWYVSWGPSHAGWQQINSSNFLDAESLRFGDFDGDGKTDVFAMFENRWYVSWSGTSGLQSINSSAYGLEAFCDVDGDGTTDVVRIQ